MRNLLKAIEISRPLLWLNTSMPLLWGAIGLRRELVASDVVLFAFFLFPYNYFLHAPNDYFDFETDARNPRKGGVEEPSRRSRSWRDTRSSAPCCSLPSSSSWPPPTHH